MKMKIHTWKNKNPHYVAFEFTPYDYYIVKSMDIDSNEYRYSLNPRRREKGITLDYGSPAIFITREHALQLIQDLHFIQVHNNNLY